MEVIYQIISSQPKKENIMNKFLFMLVSAFFILYAGCAKEKVTELRFAIWDINQKPGMEANIQAFETQNPNIKVTLELTPWDQYWLKMDAAAQINALPDVFWLHLLYAQKFAENNKLLPLNDFISNDPDIDIANYQDGLADLYRVDNTYYAIPKDYDTIGLWYNKQLFDQANISYPTESWTWNDLLLAAQKITALGNGIYGFAAPLLNQAGYYNFIYQNGGYILSADKKSAGWAHPQTIEALQFYHDLIQKYKVAPTLSELSSAGEQVRFQSGTLGMAFFGSWMVRTLLDNEYVRNNADVTILPSRERRATIYNGLGYSIAANTKYPDAAKKFLKFLGSKEGQLLQAKHGAAIPAFKETQNEWFAYFADTQKNLRIYPEQIKWGVLYPNSKSASRWYVLQEDELRKYFEDQTSLNTATNTLQSQVQQLLNDEE